MDFRDDAKKKSAAASRVMSPFSAFLEPHQPSTSRQRSQSHLYGGKEVFLNGLYHQDCRGVFENEKFLQECLQK